MPAKTASQVLPARVAKPSSDLLVIVAVVLFSLVLSAVMLPLLDPHAIAAINLTGP